MKGFSSAQNSTSSETPLASTLDFGRRYADKTEINKVGPRRAGMNPKYCHWFHCISRCCRKAMLCGIDAQTGESYQHRRQWILDRLAVLAKAFSIEIASYAIMSNHYHLVLCVNLKQAESWSADEVLYRWCQVFKGPEIIRRYLDGDNLMPSEVKYVETFVEEYRQRLVDLSWFMRALNEPLARMANREDECTGHFWQGRFTAQALLDEQAIASCMAYVDLNPLRAGIADTPEASDFTSIKQRIEKYSSASAGSEKQRKRKAQPQNSENRYPKLKTFKSNNPQVENIPFSFRDYLELVDATARVIVSGKASISEDIPRILERLDIDNQLWVNQMSNSGKRWARAAGRPNKLKAYAKLLRQFWMQSGGNSC